MPARSEVPRIERTRQQAMPHPSATNELSQVYRSLWKDVRKGRILLVPTEQLSNTVVQSSPLAAVPKMLPDRTLAAECRVVHDQRVTNQFCPSCLHPPALQPKHSQIVRLVKWWQTMLPGIPVMIAKRDIASAFRLIWVDPEDCEVFAADLPWKPSACALESQTPEPPTSSTAEERADLGLGVTAIFMVMSFGFTGAPGEWAPWGLATTALHRAYVPADPFTEGPWSFHSHILVDDAILVEPQIGNRPEISAFCYEENTRALLGENSINQDKVQLEGEYGCEATVWGLAINTMTDTIGLPEQRLLKGAHLLALPAYTAGNRDLTLRDVQRLRGTAQSWTTVLPGLRLVLRSVDLFLKPVEQDEFVRPNVRWGDEEAWEQLWAAFDLLKLLVSRPELWKERFVASMNRLLTVSEQLGLPGAHLKTRVVSSDATPQMHGAVDWKARKVTRQEVTPFMEHLARQGEDERVIIAVAELLGLVAMAAALGHTWREETVIYIGDNSNVVQWLRSRAPRNRLARLLMRALMCLEVKEKFVIHPYYVRTYHNTTADWLTRCTDAEFEVGLKMKGFEWLDAGMPWREALTASERGDLLFLVGMDAADMQVMQALAVQRIAQAETAGFTPLNDWELCDLDGEEGDYVAVWKGWGGHATHWTPKRLLGAGTTKPNNAEKPDSRETTTNTSKKLLCAGTAPPDPSGTKGLKLVQMAVEMGAEAVTLEAPRNHDWSRAERFLREKGWTVTVFQFDTSALGAAVWRKRGALLGRKGEHDRVKTPEELGLQTVLGTPARHFLQGSANEQSREGTWVARPGFILEPQLGKVFSPTGPRGAGHIQKDGSRTLVCSVGNPLPAPRVVDGQIEVVEVWDPRGKAGHLRCITPAEWQAMQQGKERGASATMASAVKSLQQSGAAVAAVLIVATVTGSARDEHRGGACPDPEDEEILYAMREWTEAWRRGQFPVASVVASAENEAVKVPRDLHSLETDSSVSECLLSSTRTLTRCGGVPRNREAAEQRARASVKVCDPEPAFNLDVQAEMEQWLSDRLGGGLAESTRKSYNRHWETWVWWCKQRSLPLYLEGEGRRGHREDENELLQYLAFHGLMGASVHKLRLMIFSVQRHHREAGAGDPLEGKQRIWLVLASMARRGAPQTRKAGVTPPMLEWLHEQLSPWFEEPGPEGLDAAVLWATVLVGYLFLARASEMVAVNNVDERKIIRSCDVAFKNEEGLPSTPNEAERIEITFRHQKADQLAFGAVRTHYRIKGKGAHLCVVRAIGRVWSRCPLRNPKGSEHHLPLLRWYSGGVVNRGALQNALKRAASAVGVPPERTVVHSLRVGGASALYQATGSIDIVQRWGRWASGAFHRYLWEAAEQSKGLAAAMTSVDATIQA
eukprot:2096399-Amphidinium_carterae.2